MNEAMVSRNKVSRINPAYYKKAPIQEISAVWIVRSHFDKVQSPGLELDCL